MSYVASKNKTPNVRIEQITESEYLKWRETKMTGNEAIDYELAFHKSRGLAVYMVVDVSNLPDETYEIHYYDCKATEPCYSIQSLQEAKEARRSLARRVLNGAESLSFLERLELFEKVVFLLSDEEKEEMDDLVFAMRNAVVRQKAVLDLFK